MQLRVIGGKLRGRTIRYNGDPELRPMKDRVRESVFNLVGPRVVGKSVVDLFAGTGAMAIEALSRGAKQALCIERRFPNARTIKDTAESLGLSDRLEVVGGDTFHWAPIEAPKLPGEWLVFCCPPYELFVSRRADLLNLISHFRDVAPVGSVFVVESDARFDTAELPDADQWLVREYPPAVISVTQK